jgi:type I restriction enzyme S subunit
VTVRPIMLSEVCSVQSGGTPSRNNEEYWGGLIPWAKISDLEASGDGYIQTTEENITEAGLKAIRGRIFDDDTLLFAMYGSVGKTAIVKGKIATNQAILGIKPQSEKLDLKYLRHWLASQQQKFEQDAQGVAQKNLSAGYIRELKIPLPTLSEQKRIAAILDKADAIRRKRQQAIQLTDEFLLALFLDIFGNPVTNGWESVPAEALALDEKGSIRTGPFGSQLLHSEFTDHGIAVLGIDNAVSNTFCWAKPRYISEEKYQELKRYTVHPGDILITIMGTCGRTAIVPDDCPTAINTKHLCCITLDKEKCTPEFLHSYFLMHPVSKDYLSRRAKGAVMDGLNMGIIKELPVYLPPIELQRKYSLIQKKILKNKNSIQLAQAGFEELFSSLSQKAFAGQL